MYNLVNGVILQRNGVCFDYHKLDVDLAEIVEGFISEDQHNDALQSIADLEKQIASLNKSRDQVQAAYLRSEEELHRIKAQYEAENANFKSHDIEFKKLKHKVEMQESQILGLPSILIAYKKTLNQRKNFDFNQLLGEAKTTSKTPRYFPAYPMVCVG